ncbi:MULTISPECIES: YbhN family protein [unclassified Neorhizobium]|uniref:lysylphosphatidylglycerol synthase transmembrane domain-containing protein n=1 Tax=unclassified Neorhizobium TaxID=2629175 RepID=UPI001FF15648|nr:MULTISPECIES: YbhN family protein [unclassified Neorhizobium]MCJ9672612.1 lysylphosphatidylglycerol synthase domain-containing protein [Neorhizobium sp. SHOUNA12B]MCJ9747028.1 lysylphosphatidylglycerol synthase domain-containing protein [Neorhizobium sp. SHOUNA12A]
MTRKKILTYGMLVIGVSAAGYLLYHTFREYSLSDIVESVRAIPAFNLLMALLFAFGSYLCLSGFDWAGVRYVKNDLAYPKIGLASFIALSIGQSVGLAGLSSGALRYRYYAHWGMSAEDVAKIVLLSGVTVGIGMAVLSGIVMVINPKDAASVLGLSETVIIAIGFACLAATAGYLALAAFVRTPLKIRAWTFEMPTLKIAIAQVVIGTINFAMVSACLREVMGATADVSYLKAATAFVLANLAILITHAPGGLGVLEATVRHVMGDQASIGSLVAFRVIYFFIPFFIGLPLSLVVEAVFRARKAKRSSAEGLQMREPAST